MSVESTNGMIYAPCFVDFVINWSSAGLWSPATVVIAVAAKGLGATAKFVRVVDRVELQACVDWQSLRY